MDKAARKFRQFAREFTKAWKSSLPAIFIEVRNGYMQRA